MVAAEQLESQEVSEHSFFYALILSARIFTLHYQSPDPLLRAYVSQRLNHDLTIASLVLSEEQIKRACQIATTSTSDPQTTKKDTKTRQIGEILGIEPTLPTEERVRKLFYLAFLAGEMRTETSHFVVFCALTAQSLINQLPVDQRAQFSHIRSEAQRHANQDAKQLSIHDTDNPLTKGRKAAIQFTHIFQVLRVQRILDDLLNSHSPKSMMSK